MTIHSKLSPSKRYRWKNCPGSIREEAKYPIPPSSPAAIDGTHSHTLLEYCITLGNDPMTYVGQTLRDHEGEFIVDAERARRVKVAFDYVNKRKEENEWVCEVIAETKVNPEYLLARDDLGGTVDVQIITPTVLELIDYKDGMNDAWDSAVLQLEQYAYGKLAEYRIPANLPYPFSIVTLTVIQPKLALKGGIVIRSTTLPVDYFLKNCSTIVLQAQATDDPNAPLIAGSWCKYCPATGCTKRMEHAMAQSGIAFPVVAEVLDVAVQAASNDPHIMTDEQLVKIIEAAPIIRDLLEKVEKEIESRLNTRNVTGVKLVNGRGSRNWALTEDEMAERLKKMGVPKDKVYVTKLVSPAQAEKLTWEVKKGDEKIVKQLSDRQLKTLKQEYIVTTAGKLTVALESDPRPVVTKDVTPLFKPIEETPSLPAWLK